MMPKIVDDPRFAALYFSCFPDAKCRNIKDLVLIPSWRASASGIPVANGVAKSG
jgi:hypothetical protein